MSTEEDILQEKLRLMRLELSRLESEQKLSAWRSKFVPVLVYLGIGLLVLWFVVGVLSLFFDFF